MINRKELLYDGLFVWKDVLCGRFLCICLIININTAFLKIKLQLKYLINIVIITTLSLLTRSPNYYHSEKVVQKFKKR